ncbi:hypothetical protein STEG23_004685 [Scotinomys teguina]
MWSGWGPLGLGLPNPSYYISHVQDAIVSISLISLTVPGHQAQIISLTVPGHQAQVISLTVPGHQAQVAF